MRALIRDGSATGYVTEVEVDEPTVHPHQALVALRVSSLNRGELALLEHRPNGWRPGQDVAGVVVEPAADGTGPASGARVIGVVHDASWSERIAVDTDRLAVLPDDVSFAQAATLGVAGLTALRLSRLAGPVLGARVLVTAPTGGVGDLLLPLLRSGGADILALARPGSSSSISGRARVVVAIGDVSQVDVVLDGVGGLTLRRALDTIRPGGVLCFYGTAGGERAGIRIEDFFGHENVVLRPFLYYSSAGHDGRDLARLVDWCAEGVLTPTIGAELAWGEVATGLDLLRRRAVPGKIIITPPSGGR